MLGDRFNARLSMAMPAGALRAMGKLNVPIYRLTRGRLMGKISRAPVLLLTATGRRSGQRRTAPVLYLEDGDRLIVVGSNAGNANTPAWSLNLQANPDAEVEVYGTHRLVRARVAEGDERMDLWRRANGQYGGFDEYEARTSRDIKVFVLEPRS
ncbi:MAG TPA: nitroreductase family deazaflavin-dependent oxidoreductase [Solirubrobacteraceae bacterium]|jgi:deazaflavin-dependent oxidoreductase (nitroreductase family)|nr:nitroreductase family deazaflavin-dependent oxidoreductase [Solirubrobacteraceae bacterium]